MTYYYRPVGVCPREIKFNVTDNTVTDVSFVGGCDGNLKALSLVINGKSIDEISHLFKGNTCGNKKTSCMDQLVVALEKSREEA
jgi:uncharacterized protein (TIGR03905 family)